MEYWWDEPTDYSSYEELVELKLLELLVKAAMERWPTPKDFADNFAGPALKADDAWAAGQVLKKGSKDRQPRKLKLREALRMCQILDLKLHYVLVDADALAEREWRNRNKEYENESERE